MKPTSSEQSIIQQWVQFSVLVATLGVVLALIGLYPGVTGLEPRSGIGILQIMILLTGMGLMIFGMLIFAKVVFYFKVSQTLAQRIAVRLSLTGLLFSGAVGLSDVLGYGSNPPAGTESFPILGMYQAIGIVLGFAIASCGVLLFTVAGEQDEELEQ